MKTITLITSLGLAAGLVLPAGLIAQPSPPPTPVVPDVDGIEFDSEEIQRSLIDVQHGLAMAQSRSGFAVGASSGYGGGGYGTVVTPGAPMPPGSGVFNSDGPRGSTEVLLLQSTEATADAAAELQEDLAVMSRVLERAVSPDLASSGKRAMGLDLMFAPDRSSTQSIYLEDYGAIFMLEIRFPLLPPVEAEAGDDPTPEPEDSEWEAARRDIYGGPLEAAPSGGVHFMAQHFAAERQQAEAYSEAKIEVLQTGVLAALKHASRIRHLNQDDFILVCINGPAAGSAKTAGREDYRHQVETLTHGTGNNVVIWTGSATVPAQGSVMTIRAKHSDILALAEGAIDPDALRDRVQVQTYASGKVSQR